MANRAIFLDRDGTLIRDVGYPSDPAAVELLPGATRALRELSRAGYLLVVVSNQSGVGRGIVTAREADAVHQRLVRELALVQVRLDAAYYCFHAPGDGCECRKPRPGLLRQAAREHDIALELSFVIGDEARDVQAGRAVGCRTLLLGEGNGGADGRAADWGEVLAVLRDMRA